MSEHFQIVVCVDATYLAPDGDLEALLADDLTLGRLLELLPHSVAVLFGVSQVTEADAHLGGCSVVSRGLHFFQSSLLAGSRLLGLPTNSTVALNHQAILLIVFLKIVQLLALFSFYPIFVDQANGLTSQSVKIFDHSIIRLTT